MSGLIGTLEGVMQHGDMDNDDRHADLTARFDRIDRNIAGLDHILGLLNQGILIIRKDLDRRFDAIDRDLTVIKKQGHQLMALDQKISDALAQLSTDIDAALAANGDTAALVQQLADANAEIATMQADEAAEPAALAALRKTADDATAALAANVAEVTSALQGLDSKVKGNPAPAPAV